MVASGHLLAANVVRFAMKKSLWFTPKDLFHFFAVNFRYKKRTLFLARTLESIPPVKKVSAVYAVVPSFPVLYSKAMCPTAATLAMDLRKRLIG